MSVNEERKELNKNFKEENNMNNNKVSWYLSIPFIVTVFILTSGCLLGIPGLVLAIMRFTKYKDKKTSNIIITVIIIIGILFNLLLAGFILIGIVEPTPTTTTSDYSEISEYESEEPDVVEETEDNEPSFSESSSEEQSVEIVSEEEPTEEIIYEEPTEEVVIVDDGKFHTGDTIEFLNGLDVTILDTGVTYGSWGGNFVYVSVEITNTNKTNDASIGFMEFYADNYLLENYTIAGYDDEIAGIKTLSPGRSMKGTYYCECNYYKYSYIDAELGEAVIAIDLPKPEVDEPKDVPTSNDVNLATGTYNASGKSSSTCYAEIGENSYYGYYMNIKINDYDGREFATFSGSIVPADNGTYEVHSYDDDTILIITSGDNNSFSLMVSEEHFDNALMLYAETTFYFESGIDYSQVS